MKVLELFSGTHSIGRVLKDKGWEVISLDRDMNGKSKLYEGYDNSDNHIKEDIMTWDYKQFNEGDFDLITASPICIFWSRLRNTWIGRKSKAINPDGSIVKKEDLQRDIDMYGKPMVDKVIEIIEYFKPKNWWIENPSTGLMKNYIEEKHPLYNTYYDFDYCKYSDWGYKKSTRFWTNVPDVNSLRCKNDCENMLVIEKQHKSVLVNTKKLRVGHKKSVDGGKGIRKSTTGTKSKYERYRVPQKLIEELISHISI